MLTKSKPSYIYTYGYPPEETELCHLEMRSFFGKHTNNDLLMSSINIHPDRSPFIRERIEILFEGDTFEDILQQVHTIDVQHKTFKALYVKTNDLTPEQNIQYDERRQMERAIGMHIDGEADVHRPDLIFGLITLEGRWYFGPYIKAKAIWLEHMKKPRNYSIALSTRMARAIANIAVPDPTNVKAIDPCCGIGTVLIEALSMGINMIGRDINHFVVQGTRENLAHFNLQSTVVCGDISKVTEHYDTVIIDMPYNHFSHTTPEAQLSLLQHARRIANKAVIVSVGEIDEMLEDVGFTITDRCAAYKGNFVRQIIVCE